MNQWRRAIGGWFLALPLFALAWGCSDTTDPTPVTTGNGSTSSGIGTGSSGKLVINEINATVEDWIEIANIGDQEADLSGFGLTDEMADGTPEIVDAVRFAAGEKLAPGAYLLVVANLMTPGTGPQTTCLMSGGPTKCYHAGWGVSAANGDRVFLLSPRDEIIDAVTYPMNAVAAGQSYCRLPNGTGEPAACQLTPGADNLAP